MEDKKEVFSNDEKLKKRFDQGKQDFLDSRKDYTEKDIQMEMLYLNWLNYLASEKTKANTSKVVWILVLSIAASVFATLWYMDRVKALFGGL